MSSGTPGGSGGVGGGGVPSGSIINTKRQTSTTNVLHGMSGTVEDKNNDYLCPICFEVINEAHITRCGHTYCYQCIIKTIDTTGRCPKCSFILSQQDIFPNFLLNELVSKYRMKIKGFELVGNCNINNKTNIINNNFTINDNCCSTINDGLRDFIKTESANLTLPDVKIMLEVLTQRKNLLEAESTASQNKLLHEFLKNLLIQKEEQKNQLQKEVEIIKYDMEQVENILRDVQNKCPKIEDIKKTNVNDTEQISAIRKEMIDLIDIIDSNMVKNDDDDNNDNNDDVDDPQNQQQKNINNKKCEYSNISSLAIRRKRMYSHFDEFVKCYFDARAKDILLGQASTASSSSTVASTTATAANQKTKIDTVHGGVGGINSGLDIFRENLVKFSRYNSLRPLATLNYSSDIFNNSTIVSSIEFDKDNEFFAIAGVTKRIKVFDYGSVIRDSVDIHYPCIEMISSSKISCVSWNSYHKGMLASSDYEGTVTVWDATTGQRTKAFQEHEKRCWSVDFNDVDTRLIASGSDDARVKLWSLNIEHSVASLEAKANVCCVKFNPRSSCHLAFGSADHCVHYYDLRNMKEALCIFKGHRKAVSYVKFINKEEIVSASTDSQLKVWNIHNPHCLRSFVGHVNEKNFVGLATDGDYVACGSENNALYVYYKGLTKQLFSYKFDAVRSVLELAERREEDPNEFVSAVCWRQNSNVVVAANSQGIIKILELV
ncbi:E3 ubiquitin-protein ligase COP1-like [Aphidius gifuensis]|uniref:E3 ubiquitin-protein ligase COP1-like n=1 Tax=Aphidius gifuensis TaxID=684658 RepID=UPI001CDB9E3A|nr:E3 ubiquitin-protein ligase COP1-like [Aphidius gifuensis]